MPCHQCQNSCSCWFGRLVGLARLVWFVCLVVVLVGSVGLVRAVWFGSFGCLVCFLWLFGSFRVLRN